MKKLISTLSRKLSAPRFICLFFLCTFLLLLVMGAFMFFVDPWLYYRIDTERDYWLDGTYVSAGLIKNMDYDAAVIGSSFFQDFRMQWFRDYFDVNPINLTMPGLDNSETIMLNDALKSAGTVRRIYVCFTPFLFLDVDEKGRVPQYLLDDNRLNDVQYIYSYEAWTKFMPLDAVTWGLNHVGSSFLDRYSSMRDIDSLGNELNRYNYNSNVVWRNVGIFNPSQKINAASKDAMLATLINNFEEFLAELHLDTSPQIQYYFILPPHSAVYWQTQVAADQFDVYMSFIQSVAEGFEQFPNAALVDCQTMDEIIDLNHYRDTTHYDLEVMEKMLVRIGDEQHYLNPSTVEDYRLALTQLLEEFCQQNQQNLEVRNLY